MRFSVLGSGSKGNSVYIESGSTGILIDAGFSGKELEKRLRSVGRELSHLKALCITHEHHDHISGAGVVARRCGIPAYANGGTFAGGEKRMGKIPRRIEFETGGTFEIGDLQVRSFRLSHDTADPVGFVINDGKKSLGYCTDTGKVSHLMAQRLRRCNGLILEFNHNLEMLKNGPYPLPLQQRVRSSLGHLCNEDAAELLAMIQGDQLQCLVQAHLSDKNNTPELARRAAAASFTETVQQKMYTAPQHQALGMISL
jgi:phosphoribosyl 1,2-cyclic phosphodiesterase